MNENVYLSKLRCMGCDATFARDTDLLLCPHCSSLVDPVYDLNRLQQDFPSLDVAQRRGQV